MARKEVKTYVCISDISGEEFAEGTGAKVTIAFDSGKTYIFDSTQEEAHAILAGVKSPSESKARGSRAKGGSKRPSFGPKGAAGKLNELKADAAKAKAYFADKDAAWFETALKNANDDVKKAWADFRGSL
ncbi:MAG: hypothetical protein JW395_0267 [Nitrospira sp.]|nr:hypothetical protein [Nitrospira sp.]